MFRLIVIFAALGAASCGRAPSDTLGQFGDYQNVEGTWRERSDPVDGPSKALSYATWSDDKRGSLVFGCFAGEFTGAVDMDGSGEMAWSVPAVVGLRRDDAGPVDYPFFIREGEKWLRPGRATGQDAQRFLSTLGGTSRLGFKIRTLMGIKNTDPPLTFDVRGADEVAHNLEIACRQSS